MVKIKKVILSLSTALLTSQIIFADTNGIWHNAQDIRGGIFGENEQDLTNEFTFINPVKFEKTILSSNPNYYINLTENTKLNQLITNQIKTNKIEIQATSTKAISATSDNEDAISAITNSNDKTAIYGLATKPSAYSGYFDGGKFKIDTTSIYFEHLKSCNGNIGIKNDGELICGTDNINDADSDPNNEIQSLTISDRKISLSNNGGEITLPTDNVNDADSSTTNELQTLSISGREVTISNGNKITLPVDNVNDADSSTTNELQTLSISGNRITLSNNGGYVDIPTPPAQNQIKYFSGYGCGQCPHGYHDTGNERYCKIKNYNGVTLNSENMCYKHKTTSGKYTKTIKQSYNFAFWSY